MIIIILLSCVFSYSYSNFHVYLFNFFVYEIVILHYEQLYKKIYIMEDGLKLKK